MKDKFDILILELEGFIQSIRELKHEQTKNGFVTIHESSFNELMRIHNIYYDEIKDSKLPTLSRKELEDRYLALLNDFLAVEMKNNVFSEQNLRLENKLRELKNEYDLLLISFNTVSRRIGYGL